MSVFLRVCDGTATRDIAVLQPGQLLTIGRGESCDVAFPDDQQMSFRHCTLRLQSETCLLTDLSSTNGTLIKGQPVAAVELHHGDSFKCGNTEFVLDWSLAPQPEQTSAAIPAKVAPVPKAASDSSPAIGTQTVAGTESSVVEASIEPVKGFCSTKALEIVTRFKLNQKISLTPEDDESAADFVERLRPLKDGIDALCFLSFALPKRCAVWWATECIRAVDDLDEHDVQVLELIEEWLRDPTDMNRRNAQLFVEEYELDSLATWAAQAVFFCHGSTTPANCPAVPPKDDLAGKTVFAAVSLASVEGEPSDIPQRRRQFAELAVSIAAGKHPWPTDVS